MVLQNYYTLIKFLHIFSFRLHLCNCVNFHAWSDIVVSLLLLAFTNLTHWYAAVEWQRNAVSAETLTKNFNSNFVYFLEFVGPKEKDPDLDVSDDAIYENRLSIEEIKMLPKFVDYAAGNPSKVLLIVGFFLPLLSASANICWTF